MSFGFRRNLAGTCSYSSISADFAQETAWSLLRWPWDIWFFRLPKTVVCLNSTCLFFSQKRAVLEANSLISTLNPSFMLVKHSNTAGWSTKRALMISVWCLDYRVKNNSGSILALILGPLWKKTGSPKNLWCTLHPCCFRLFRMIKISAQLG